MENKPDAAHESGLQFFGKMTASISHELKNVLAIVNENAGLLEDFVLMANKGRPLDPERLKTLAGKIMDQVRRGDGIIMNMNTFAHSVDETVKPIDLGELLMLVVSLSNRFASMRGVTLSLKSPQNAVSVTTNQFFLENLVWHCLDFAMNAAGRGNTVNLTAEKAGEMALIRFSMLDSPMGSSENMFPGKQEEGLLRALKGQLTSDMENGEVVLGIPSDIKQ